MLLLYYKRGETIIFKMFSKKYLKCTTFTQKFLFENPINTYLAVMSFCLFSDFLARLCCFSKIASTVAHSQDRLVPIAQSRQRSRARNFVLSARKVFRFMVEVKTRRKKKTTKRQRRSSAKG